MEKNENENNIKEIKNSEKQKDGDAFFASSAENTENSSEEENNQGKKNNLNYKNLISHPPKTEIEVLDNIKGDKFDFNFKIIVIGNSGVGKSCLTLKATKDIFQENFVSTMGFQFYSFHVKINDKVFKLQIWDTCGQEIYRSLITNFYRTAALAIIVYSVTDKKSFDETEIWLKQVKLNADPNCKIFLIANKVDLPNKEVSSEAGMNLKKERGFECYMETSAKTGVNVKELFVNCALSLYKELPKYIKEKEILENENGNTFNLNDNVKDGIKVEDGDDCAC
jgi:small GTP-binding protein